MFDATTDPGLRTFIEVDPNSPFPIQNLPFGIFKPHHDEAPRVGVAIGDFVLDLAVLEEKEFFDRPEIQQQRPFSQSSLNAFMAMGRPVWQAVRRRVSHLLAPSA